MLGFNENVSDWENYNIKMNMETPDDHSYSPSTIFPGGMFMQVTQHFIC